MIFAAIDIGSNAMRLLFANIFDDKKGKLSTLRTAFIRIPIRLGGDVFLNGCISPQREEKLIKTLTAFKTLIEVNDAIAFDVCATSAMREASNGAVIVERIRQQLGINVRVIEGQEEARIIREAGEIHNDHPLPLTMYVDVGGGSTEISVMEQDTFRNSFSFKIGTLRILNEKVDRDEWRKLDQWLDQFKDQYGSIECVGSGGNINKITKLFGNKEKKVITRKQLESAYKNLSKLNIEERVSVYNLRNDRADVIVPAAEIYLYVTQKIQAKQIIAPKFGLADGLVIHLYKEWKRKGLIPEETKDDDI